MKVLLLCALLAIPAGSVLVAQWTTDPTANTAFALGKDKRYDLTAISDASGNVYSAWYDVSTGTTGGVYVQKTSPSGSLPWGAAGVRVDSIPESFQSPTLALDGSGGVFVSWVDSRSANSTQNIYAQHISAGGVPQWQTSGANITNLGEFSFRSPINPQSLGDGSGNYFLSWEDAFGLTLMKVSSSGSVAWTTPVDDTLGAVDSRITSDGSGGIILSWTDDRGLSTDIANIYAQKVNSGGTAVWAHNGILVCGATNLQEYSQIVGDGSGGAIIAWQDFRDASHFRGYAQRINSNGVPQWTADGVPISTTTNSINGLVMTTDGAGGAEFAWEEARGTGIGGSDNIYGQRLNSSGQRQWSDSGANVCVNTAPQENPAITSDGNGGATIVWSDNRSSGANENIYGQRVNAAGSVAWTADGILISGASGNQERPLVVSMPSNSAVAIWYDFRLNGGSDVAEIYGQYISAGGALSGVKNNPAETPASFELSQNFPNPFNPSTEIRFNIAQAGPVTLKVYDLLGREVATLISGDLTPGSYHVTWNAGRVASGAYFYRLQSGNSVESKKLLLMK